MPPILALLLATLQFLVSTNAQNDFKQKCLAFKPDTLTQSSILQILEHIPANTSLAFPGNDESCNRASQLISSEACRVALTIPTSNRSGIVFELFLPTPEEWTGRFLGTGNGGIDGCIKYEDMAYGLRHGFAVTGSNNGHNGTSGFAFLHNPDIVTDFSYRSLHTTATAGKTLVRAFYGKPHTKSYYIGCSGGGRQAIQSASLYPTDYDGIIAGAPGVNFNYMSSWRASFYPLTGPKNSSDFIKAETWQGLIHDEILRQCDELDGVRDGVLTDPGLCAGIFDPETLLCGEKGGQCLSEKQVEVVRQVFSPLHGENGELIYPGLQPGAEVRATERLLSGTPFPYSEDWFKYVVFSNPSWDPATWTIRDATVAEAMNPGNARSWPDTLAPFRDRGAKMMIYHGGADQQITGFNTERFYHRLSSSMDHTNEQLDDFLRFFRIPGMGHCSGGLGAWQFGQTGAAGVEFEPGMNVLAAVVDWVENGKAPEMILGTKFVNDTVDMGVDYQRSHCRYPFRSTYIGGDSKDVDSWACKLP
ncbi:ferulic acid esterase [Zopfia rhizophila CBS 207.26]|uniref:Carboxylic ester hydrolase n=1 Tax=Zopfia rhizophila CBS 207.26 TaxID=1314779 RepID=A0A6A6E571_9PEZI|nr:ferulic acid esterase [Zopfia rhizophila CBS 207.26]